MKCRGIENLTVCHSSCKWKKEHKCTLKCKSIGHCYMQIKCNGQKDNTKKRDKGRVTDLRGDYR